MKLEFAGSSSREVVLLLDMMDGALVFPVRGYASREPSHERLSFRTDTSHARGSLLMSGILPLARAIKRTFRLFFLVKNYRDREAIINNRISTRVL